MAQKEVCLLTSEAKSFLHLTFKIDRFWRKLSIAASKGKIRQVAYLETITAWDNLVARNEEFLSELWMYFDKWQDTKNPVYEIFLKSRDDRVRAFKFAIKSIEKMGTVYSVSINSEYGDKFFGQCRSLDRCFKILENFCFYNHEATVLNIKIRDQFKRVASDIINRLSEDEFALEKVNKIPFNYKFIKPGRRKKTRRSGGAKPHVGPA
jgi:hypothetical protein